VKISFRVAEPKDVAIAVPLIYATGPAAFEYVFKVSEQKDAQQFLKYVFTTSGGEFSYTNHTCVLDKGDNIIGIGGAFGSEMNSKFTINAIRYIISFYGLWNGIKVIRRGLAIEKIIAPPKGNTEVLVHISVIESLRGNGIGSKLIQHFIEKAKFKKRSTVSLDVSEENPYAKALYERLGFATTKKNISSLKNKYATVPNHIKMHKALK